MQDQTPLAAARFAVVGARKDLRRNQTQLAEITALCEHDAIIAAGDAGTGKNERERERYLTLALTNDQRYKHAARLHHSSQSAVDYAQAKLDILLDAIRERRTAALERLADNGLTEVLP